METTLDEIFLTLNLEDKKLKGKWQLIHVENTEQTTFGILCICDCKVLNKKYKIDNIRFRVMNFCGEILGIDSFVPGEIIGSYDLTLKTLDVAHPIEKEFSVDVILSKAKKFNLKVEMSVTTGKSITVGTRICQIEVA
jgi:hypothetical protein